MPSFTTPPILAYISDLVNSDFSIAPWPVIEPTETIETYENRIFRLLSELPDVSYLDDHGQKTLEVINSINQPTTNSRKLVSVRYFSKGTLIDFTERLYPTDPRVEKIKKISIAFTSPAILKLPAGSVVGMNMSSPFEINGNTPITISPALFDQAVNGIISILAERGVTTVLSIGNQGVKVSTATPLILSTAAIMVGAIRKDTRGKNEFDSNYGNVVTCYAETPAKINGQSVLVKGKPFGNSSAAMAIITGLVLKIQRHRLSQNKRYLLPHEIKSILSEAQKVAVQVAKTNGKAIPFEVPLPTWEGIVSKVDAIPSDLPIS